MICWIDKKSECQFSKKKYNSKSCVECTTAQINFVLLSAYKMSASASGLAILKEISKDISKDKTPNKSYV